MIKLLPNPDVSSLAMKRTTSVAILVGAICATSAFSALAATPLDAGLWAKVGHMSAADAGMFNGDCNLASTGCTYGPDAVGDSWIPFPQTYTGQRVLFITGDRLVWALGTYGDLAAIVTAGLGDRTPNITWADASLNGTSMGPTVGNVLMRPLSGEDPWVTLQGEHCANNCSTMLWGEGNFTTDIHPVLEHAHNGVDVYVSVSKPTVAPTIAAISGANGWYVSPVSLSWAVGLATSSAGCGSVGPLADTKGATYTCTATNDYGSTSVAQLIKQDTIKPTATITVPANGATYKLNAAQTVSFTCADATSGVNTCVGTLATGAKLKTSTAGTYTFTVNATDKAGNATTSTVTYKVK